MTRAITKEPPRGSRLAAYLSYLLADKPDDGILRDADGTPLWQSADPALRYLGEEALKDAEPRLWELPDDFVRDRLILPALANAENPEAARALKTYAPLVLDHFTYLICDAAKREATARQRLARSPNNSGLATLIIWAAIADGYDASRSLNANFTRVESRLGPSLDRGVVRRTVAKVMRRLRGMDESKQALFRTAANVVREKMAEMDRKTPPRRTA